MMQPDPQRGGSDSLLDALKEVEQDRQKKLQDRQRARQRDRWFGWTRRFPGGVQGLLFSVVGIFLVLIGDGIRREGQEFTTRIAATHGQVMLQKDGASSSVTAAVNTLLHEGDQLLTIRDGEAILVFPDRSAILVEPNTRLEVRQLGFSRGEVRDRSFLVHFGSAVAHFSRQFGRRSRGAVSSPAAIAASHGASFHVAYDPGPSRKQTYLAVLERTVQFRTTAGANQVIANQFCVAAGPRIQVTHTLPRPVQQRIAVQLQALRQYDRSPGFLESLEKRINTTLNPVLQLLGFAPGGWSYQSTDFARVAATREALRRLGAHLKTTAGGPPDALNPLTLEELRLDAHERDRLLNTFSGAMLESYRKTGKNQYVLRARARDQGHTLFELGPGSVREVKE